MKKLLGLLLPCMVLFTGCATIMHGTRQAIGISSHPSNAQIWVDHQYAGQTPMIVKMTRKDNHFVSIYLEGYQSYEIVFTRQLSGWVFGNIIFGGVIGLAVDAISGGIYRLTPEQVEAQMAADNIICSAKADSYVAIVMKVDPSWEKIAQLSPQ